MSGERRPSPIILLGGVIAVAAYLFTKKSQVVAVTKAAAKKIGGRTLSKAEDFVSRYRNAAEIVGRDVQLPAWLILTQAAHESAYGLSGLAQKAYNFFGFTGESWKKQGKPVVTMPTREFLNGKWVALDRPFRAYGGADESMRDYARLLLSKPRYAAAVAAARRGDVAGTFDALGKSGYATDPNYGGKLAGVYQAVKTFLA